MRFMDHLFQSNTEDSDSVFKYVNRSYYICDEISLNRAVFCIESLD